MTKKAAPGDHVLVLGAGNFGTCLAQHLAEQGYLVTVWTRSTVTANAINTSHKNPKYLGSLNLSPRLRATNKIDKALLNNSAAVLYAAPAQALRTVLETLRQDWPSDLLLVSAAKGIEQVTGLLPEAVISEVLGTKVSRQAVFLSGPSFAVEVAAKQPTGVTVASFDADRCKRVQHLFHAPHFRVYTSDDPIGVEMAGALKNVIAIASGGSMGLGFQMNSRAALITRGLAEMTRIGVAAGANPLTFKGLSGVGDLFLTCTSEKSRNYRVGFRLGCGTPLTTVLKELGSVAEGVATSKAAFDLTRRLGIEAPIMSEVYYVLYEGKGIEEAARDLMSRSAKAELE